MEKDLPCFKDLTKNCPPDCNLHKLILVVYKNIAKTWGITIEEAVRRTRKMNAVKRAQVQALIEGGLVLAGADKLCTSSETPKITAHFG